MTLTELTQLLLSPCMATTAAMLAGTERTTFEYAAALYLRSSVRTRESRRYAARRALAQ